MIDFAAEREVIAQFALHLPAEAKEIAMVVAGIVPEPSAAEACPFLVRAKSLLHPDRHEKLSVAIAKPALRVAAGHFHQWKRADLRQGVRLVKKPVLDA